MKPLLDIIELHKVFPAARGGNRWWPAWSRPAGTRAVDGVSFTVHEGEVFGLVGESGCGKTTVARCVLRLLEPTGGRIHFLGRDWLSVSGTELRRARKSMQAVFQNPYESLNTRMRVEEIVEEPLIIHGLGQQQERKGAVAELLDMVGLQGEQSGRHPGDLSGGQRQRVALARALATGPMLLVADEPVSSLDVSIQAQIINLLGKLQQQFQLTILFISHSLPLVRRLCDRVAVMQSGRFVEVRTTTELFESPQHPYTRQLLQAAPRLAGLPGRPAQRS